METAAVMSFFICLFSFVYWFVDDNDNAFVFFVGVISLLVFAFSVGEMVKKEKQKEEVVDSITVQEIEYAINKCSSFGGLKEFRSDVIICMDKTEINMNFEPEKKVEAE